MTRDCRNSSSFYGEMRSVLAAPDRQLPERLLDLIHSTSEPWTEASLRYLSDFAYRWDPRREHVPFARLASAWMQGECLILLECLQGFPTSLLKHMSQAGADVLHEALEWAHWGGLDPGHCWFRFIIQDPRSFREAFQWLSSRATAITPYARDDNSTSHAWTMSGARIDRGNVELDWSSISLRENIVEISFLEGEPWDNASLLSLFEAAFRLGCREIIDSSWHKGPESAFALYSSMRLAP